MSAQAKLNEAQRQQDIEVLLGLIAKLNDKRSYRDKLRDQVDTFKEKVTNTKKALDTCIEEIEVIEAQIGSQKTLDLFDTPAITGVPKEAFDQPQPAPEAMAAQQSNSNQPIMFSFAPTETDSPEDGPFNNKELIIFVRGSEERHIATEEAERRLLNKGPDGYATMELLFDSTLEAIGKLSEEQREEFYLSLPIHYEIALVIPDDNDQVSEEVHAVFSKGPETRYLTEEILCSIVTVGMTSEELETVYVGDLTIDYLSKLPFLSQTQLEAVWQQLPAPEVSDTVKSFFTPVEGQASAAATPSQVEGSSYLQNKFKLTRLEDGRIVLQHKNKSKVVSADRVSGIEESYDCTFEEIPESAMEDVWSKMAKAYKPETDKKENPVTEEASDDLDEIKFMHKSDGSIILTSSLRSKLVDADTIEKIRTIGLFIEEGNASVSIAGEMEELSLAQTRALFLSSYAKPYQKTERNVVGLASRKRSTKKNNEATV